MLTFNIIKILILLASCWQVLSAPEFPVEQIEIERRAIPRGAHHRAVDREEQDMRLQSDMGLSACVLCGFLAVVTWILIELNKESVILLRD